MSLFSFLLPKQRQLKIVRRSETRLRLQEWRSQKELVSAAVKVWSDPDFQMMFSVLRNEHPGSMVVLSEDSPPNISLAIQRRAEGYTMALANLEAMARLELPTEPLEATFEDEEMADNAG